MKYRKIIFPICFFVWGTAFAQTPPSSADNSRSKYLRPVFDHLGHACGFAAGIGYAFTYEMDAARDLNAKDTNNQYSYIYPYHFFNDGLDSVWTDDFTLAFDLVIKNGIPNCTDQGGFENGFPTKWMNGYDKYYRGMKNKISDYFAIDLLASDGLDKMKRWLSNHSNGSSSGGLLNFGILCQGLQQAKIPLGSPEAGATITTFFGCCHHHSMTIVGYNDSVRYDMNNDKKYTNNLDINGDGKVDLQDWEIGAFKYVNSWGLSFGDSGFAYAPYSFLATPAEKGGISRENKVYGIHVIKDYSPKLAIRATITHTARNNIKITAGVSENPDATKPDKIKTFGGLFNFAGGAYPMQGEGRSATIEIGLDITELKDSIQGNTGKFFLIVECKDVGGTVDSVALMDYTSQTVRITSSDRKAVPVAPNSTLNLGIVGTLPIKESGAPVRKYARFIASPNPVPFAGKVHFTPPRSFDEAVLSIATAAGKVVFQARYKKGECNRIEWDLKSRYALPIAKGVYQAKLSLKSGATAAWDYTTAVYVK